MMARGAWLSLLVIPAAYAYLLPRVSFTGLGASRGMGPGGGMTGGGGGGGGWGAWGGDGFGGAEWGDGGDGHWRRFGLVG